MSTSPVSLNTPTSSVLNTSANSQAQSSSSSTASSQSAIDALGNPDTFLQLLVAQLQYQDPESPADGTTFVTQLATFAGVEEQSAMRGDLDSINGVAQKYAATLATPATTTATTTNSSGTDASGDNAASNTAGANASANTSANTTGASN